MTYKALSKYRGVLMGFAILWVMYFHIPIKSVTEVGWFIHRIGFYGVDIFLFLSGLKKKMNPVIFKGLLRKTLIILRHTLWIYENRIFRYDCFSIIQNKNRVSF